MPKVADVALAAVNSTRGEGNTTTRPARRVVFAAPLDEHCLAVPDTSDADGSGAGSGTAQPTQTPSSGSAVTPGAVSQTPTMAIFSWMQAGRARLIDNVNDALLAAISASAVGAAPSPTGKRRRTIQAAQRARVGSVSVAASAVAERPRPAEVAEDSGGESGPEENDNPAVVRAHSSGSDADGGGGAIDGGEDGGEEGDDIDGDPQKLNTAGMSARERSQMQRALALRRKRSLLQASEARAQLATSRRFVLENAQSQCMWQCVLFTLLAAQRLKYALDECKSLVTLRRHLIPILALRQRAAWRREKEAELAATMPHPSIATLQADKVLGQFSAEHLRSIFSRLRPAYFAAREIILFEGTEGKECYIVQKGLAEVLVRKDGVLCSVATLSPDNKPVVGSLGMISGEPRMATIRAVTDCAMWYLTRENFEKAAGCTAAMAQAVAIVTELHEKNILSLYRQQLTADHLSRYPTFGEIDPHLLLPLVAGTDKRGDTAAAGGGSGAGSHGGGTSHAAQHSLTQPPTGMVLLGTKAFRDGDVIFKAGERPQAAFWVLRGGVSVHHANAVAATAAEGTSNTKSGPAQASRFLRRRTIAAGDGSGSPPGGAAAAPASPAAANATTAADPDAPICVSRRSPAELASYVCDLPVDSSRWVATFDAAVAATVARNKQVPIPVMAPVTASVAHGARRSLVGGGPERLLAVVAGATAAAALAATNAGAAAAAPAVVASNPETIVPSVPVKTARTGSRTEGGSQPSSRRGSRRAAAGGRLSMLTALQQMNDADAAAATAAAAAARAAERAAAVLRATEFARMFGKPWVGLSALILGEPLPATVRAIGNVDAFVLTRDDLLARLVVEPTAQCAMQAAANRRRALFMEPLPRSRVVAACFPGAMVGKSEAALRTSPRFPEFTSAIFDSGELLTFAPSWKVLNIVVSGALDPVAVGVGPATSMFLWPPAPIAYFGTGNATISALVLAKTHVWTTTAAQFLDWVRSLPPERLGPLAQAMAGAYEGAARRPLAAVEGEGSLAPGIALGGVLAPNTAGGFPGAGGTLASPSGTFDAVGSPSAGGRAAGQRAGRGRGGGGPAAAVVSSFFPPPGVVSATVGMVIGLSGGGLHHEPSGAGQFSEVSVGRLRGGRADYTASLESSAVASHRESIMANDDGGGGRDAGEQSGLYRSSTGAYDKPRSARRGSHASPLAHWAPGVQLPRRPDAVPMGRAIATHLRHQKQHSAAQEGERSGSPSTARAQHRPTGFGGAASARGLGPGYAMGRPPSPLGPEHDEPTTTAAIALTPLPALPSPREQQRSSVGPPHDDRCAPRRFKPSVAAMVPPPWRRPDTLAAETQRAVAALAAPHVSREEARLLGEIRRLRETAAESGFARHAPSRLLENCFLTDQRQRWEAQATAHQTQGDASPSSTWPGPSINAGDSSPSDLSSAFFASQYSRVALPVPATPAASGPARFKPGDRHLFDR